MLLYILCSWWY